MVDFHKDWYNKLIAKSNEKDLLVAKISDLLQGKSHRSCLEIGLGTSAYFSSRLASYFNNYTIVEKNKFYEPLPSIVKLIVGDFESTPLHQQYDVILASHVVYYFNDLPRAVKKIVDALTVDGRAYFVVNGSNSDYGPTKHAFASFINKPYQFTYDILKAQLIGLHVREYTTQASISFSSHEDLFETLRLSFDLFPNEYEENRSKMTDRLKNNIKGDKFFVDQKIIEVSKK